MAVTLKDETILNEWDQLVHGAAGNSQGVYNDIQRILRDFKVPGDWSADLEEVQSGGFFAKTKREFMIVRLDQFKDYRHYIGARDYGTALYVCRFLTVEPGFFKKAISAKLAEGDWAALSAPKNLLVEQDLRAWVTVVHHATTGAVETLLAKLGQDKSALRRDTRGILQVW
jgi:hypothetical protein